MEQSAVDKNLIKKYLKGQANEEEQYMVNHFLQQPGAQQLFDQVWLEVDGEMNNPAPVGSPTSTKALDWKNQMLEKIGSDKSSTSPSLSKRNTFYRYAAVWLVLILGLGSYSVFKFTDKPAMETVAMLENHNPNGRRTIILLSDGSKVYLGAASSARYPKKFGDSSRILFLRGEAFFEIAKNPKKPFIIHTGEVQTKVLGTSFKIEAFKDRPLMVAVSTGKVRVDRLEDGQLNSLAVLVPGQRVTWFEKEHRIDTSLVNAADVSSWKDGRLVFNEAPLKDIIPVLERWYDVKINMQGHSVKNMHINITLKNNLPINKVMDVLSATGHFKYTLKDRSITIH